MFVGDNWKLESKDPAIFEGDVPVLRILAAFGFSGRDPRENRIRTPGKWREALAQGCSLAVRHFVDERTVFSRCSWVLRVIDNCDEFR